MTPPREGSAAARGRRRWRHSLRPRWREVRGPALTVVAIAAFVLGTIGYLQYDGEKQLGFLDSVYRSLKLFGLGSGEQPPLPATLEIARFLAPLALGFAALQGLILLFREQLQVLGIRRRRGHTVIAGLGTQGWYLVRSFYDAGYAVVAIERNPANEAIAGCSDLGVPVLIGDARHAGVLRRARLARAQNLIVTCGGDGTNFDVALNAAATVVGRRRGVLTVFAHVRDLRLWRALKAEAVAAIDSPEYRLEFFNVFSTAARIMLDRFPPFEDASGKPIGRPHICVVGLDGPAEGLVLQIATLWRAGSPDRKLPVTIAGPKADEKLAGLLGRYPELERICEIAARPADIAEERFRRGDVLLDASGRCTVTRAFVSLASGSESLAAAISLRAHPATANVQVVVALDDEQSGTALALRSEGANYAQGVEPFGVLSTALTPALTLQGMNEQLARAKHSDYVRAEREKGETGAAVVPWDELPETLKDSNRRFADGVGAVLKAAGCTIAPAPLIDANGPLFQFTQDEVEELAKREHDRWMRDLLNDGWQPTSGPKDPVAKLHPGLISWKDLTEGEREKDRAPMRLLPQMMARVGFELYRTREDRA